MSATQKTKWTKQGTSDCRAYTAQIGGRWYRVMKAGHYGWQVESAEPGNYWRHDSYVRTLAQGKAWAEGQVTA